MNALLGNVVPILFLIVFGYALRRMDYFEETAIRRLTSMVANLLIPCVIFTTIVNLDIRSEHLVLAIGIIVYQGVLLLLSWLVYKALHIKRRFFPFFSCVFSFGFMAVPLFTTTFGAENMGYLVAMGVGHELFVSLIYLTTCKLYLKGERPTGSGVLKTLLSPLFVMVFAALILKFTGLVPIVSKTVLGAGFFGAVAKLGAMTPVLTMLIVGYRLRLQNLRLFRESALYVAFRYALTFGIGYAMKLLLFDRLVAPSPYFDYAFFTLLSQHGSVVLTVFVGEYGSQEDLEVASNAFVINVLVGIAMYVLFVARIGA